MDLLALDVAILPPPDVAEMAMTLSAALPASESQGLRLDLEHLPHVTLLQQFVRTAEFNVAAHTIDEIVRPLPPLRLRVSGTGASGRTVWMTIDRTPELVDLHERLMQALRGVERPGGTTAAFAGDDARLNDVVWVSTYRLKASFSAFTPHITLGHATAAPEIVPFEFEATTVAACQLGRFCTCRSILRSWTLKAAPG